MAQEIATLDYSGGSSVPLYLDTEHPASSYGMGVLILGPNPDGEGLPGEPREEDIIDGMCFRLLRDRYGDRIFCKPGQRARVCRALGVAEDEPGIVEATA
jgi:hypothetical protein